MNPLHRVSEDDQPEEEHHKDDPEGEEVSNSGHGSSGNNGNGNGAIERWLMRVSAPLAVAIAVFAGGRGCRNEDRLFDLEKNAAVDHRDMENLRDNYGGVLKDLRIQIDAMNNKLDEVRMRLGGNGGK